MAYADICSLADTLRTLFRDKVMLSTCCVDTVVITVASMNG